MRCTAELTEKAERHHDDDLGEYVERYSVTVSVEATLRRDEWQFDEDTFEVEAVDEEGDTFSWRWCDLSTREKYDAEAGLVEDANRQALEARASEDGCEVCGRPFVGQGGHSRCTAALNRMEET